MLLPHTVAIGVHLTTSVKLIRVVLVRIKRLLDFISSEFLQLSRLEALCDPSKLVVSLEL